MYKRVVVTGIGMVTSIGIGKDTFWDNLISGKSGISTVESIDTTLYEMENGGEVKNFQPAAFEIHGRYGSIPRASQFAIAASKMAINDSEISYKDLSIERIAVFIGTTMGEGGMIEQIDRHWIKSGEDAVWGSTISKYPSNSISDNVARELDLNGFTCVIPTACSAGNYSVGYGYDLIKTGLIKRAVVGGSDPFSRIGFTGFSRLFAMAPERCSPFDKNRMGMMVGEGAGVLVLEDLESAQSRGARIYAEILGYGLSCDAHHMTAPSVSGIAKVINKTIRNSSAKKEDVGYICAHGTGTPANDKAECDAIKEVFGDLTKKLSVSSIKSMLGHTMGAASAIEAITCCLTVKQGIIPPTINYTSPDPECDIDCVPNKAKHKDVKVALNNSLAFGGNNACVAIGRFDG